MSEDLRWQEVASFADLEAARGSIMFATWDRFKVALYLVEGQVFATNDLCTHGGAQLSEGYLEGYLIECPLHQGLFDIRTGDVAGLPCKKPVRIFPVKVEGDAIILGFPPPRLPVPGTASA